MGLAQREIEAAGISTITLSNIPDLTAAVSAPRVVGIEHPFGLTLGMPGDQAGHLAVLRAVFDALQAMDTPGSVMHTPFKWPEAQTVDAHPPEPPPIAKHLVRRPWLYLKLIKREVD